MRRTKEQWQALIQAQAISGLSATEFCKQHGLNDKYFSLRKQQLRQPASDSSFVPVAKAPGDSGRTNSNELTLNYGQCAIQFRCALAAAWLAELVQALS